MNFIASLTFIPTWFSQGLLHPLLTPSHIILIIGLGFLIGQNSHIFRTLILLLVSSIIGIALNQSLSLSWNIELILLVCALIVGLLVALKLKRIGFLVSIITVVSGLLLGYDSSPIVIPGLGDNSIYNWLLGAAVSIMGTTALASLLALLLRRFWDGIILRVIGSWIATSALFTLTLSFAPFAKI